jgi:oxygen-independent coproporphyrinogen-3 oxidase
MHAFSNLPPLALYIHLPWCVRKCPYCDFNSHQGKDNIPQVAYIEALLSDLEQDLSLVWGRRLSSIFIGGGTPSLFDPEQLDRLLGGIRARITCLPDMEMTMEANPGTFEQERFRGFRDCGINRLSIGIQSFDDRQLQALGRIHNADEAHRAVEMARHAGFDNINLDLMFGLPGQSLNQGLADLEQALALEPEHLSWYQLTIEPNTLFHNQPPVLPDDDLIWDLQQQGQQRLAEAGFKQYEISAYARDGRECRHNLNYWQFGDYLGIGAGAHGKLSSSQPAGIQRLWKLRQPEAYMAASDRVSGREWLSEADTVFEFMLNGLRLKQGFDESTFMTHTGLGFERIRQTCEHALEHGLMNQEGDCWRASEQGYWFLNDLIGRFQPD